MTTAQPQPGARVGKACPLFTITTVGGEVIRSRDILARKAFALMFSDAALPAALAQRVGDLMQRYPNDLAIVVVSTDADEDATSAYPIVHDGDGTLARTFGRQEPFEGYFVRRDGLVTRIARGSDPLLTDPDAFQRLIVAMIG